MTGKGRRYRSTLRDEQAEQTRLRIAQAARVRFVEQGWAGTTMRSVAAAAGVSEATVYAVYGNKAGLAIALVDGADRAADAPRMLAELEAHSGDPRAQLSVFVRFECRLFAEAGDALRVIVEGRRNDQALQAAYEEGRGRGDRTRRAVFETWPPSALRAGVDVDRALDVFAVTVSIQTYDIAVRERGWSADTVEQWWLELLSDLLLSGADVTTSTRSPV